MQNSLKGNEAGMFLQDGKEMNYIIFDNRHTENIEHTGKKTSFMKNDRKLFGHPYNCMLFFYSVDVAYM